METLNEDRNETLLLKIGFKCWKKEKKENKLSLSLKAFVLKLSLKNLSLSML